MASIKKHIKPEVRAKFGDIIVYNPNNKQRKELIQIVIDNTKISEGTIQGDFGIDIIRKMLKDLTNINNKEIDSLSDEELDRLSDFNELEGILSEVAQKVASDTIKDLKKAVNNIKKLNDLEELGKTIKEFEDVCKEKGIDISLKDFAK